MRTTRLDDQAAFSLVTGLWKGECDPLMRACVIRGTNFRGDGLLDFSDVVELEVESRYLEERRLQNEDIIIERSGGGPKQPVGRVALFVHPDARTYFTSNFTTAIRVIDRTRFDPQYVALYLHALYLAGATETLQRAPTGIRNLDWQEYLKFEIPEIDPFKQRMIARLLHGVRAPIAAEERQLAWANEIKRAAMDTLLARGLRGEARRETEIGPIPQSWVSAVVSSTVTPLRFDRALQVLTSEYLTSGELPIIDQGQAPIAGFTNDLNRKIHRSGPLIVFGDHTRSLKYVDFDHALGADGTKPLVPSSEFDPKFLFYALSNLAIPARGYNRHWKLVAEMQIPKPSSVDEQREIAETLTAIDRKIDLHRRKREVLEELFKALLHKLMTVGPVVDQLNVSEFAAAPEPEVAA